MGACECENPMEFGYEVHAEEKDEKKQKNNKNYQNDINTINNNEKKYINTISNIVSTESNREKNYIDSDFKQLNNFDSQELQNDNNYTQNEEKEKQLEGVNALRARYENEKKQKDENVEIYQLDNKQLLFTTSIDEPRDTFSKYIFDNINSIRENPQSFIPKIEKAKSNISYDKNGICIFKSSVKVALSRGEPAFDETIEFLKNLKPMKKLLFSSELLITPPESEEQLKDRAYMNELINQKLKSGIPIKSFWRDIIKDRETCLLLMIVDDTGANSGKKRNDILDSTMQCIGITSKKIGKNFASYVTLC